MSNQFSKFLRSAWLAITILMLTVQAPFAAPQTLTFQHENVSDLRGILNVFNTFRQACIEQPVSSDLPKKIVPEGYQIVSREAHLWGEQEGKPSEYAAILSKTGSEQGDWNGGHIYVDFLMPSDKVPAGRCAVNWQRAWDYKEDTARIALGLYGVIDAQISFHLAAVLNSRPHDSLLWKRRTYAEVSEWFTRCWDNNVCNFKVIYDINPDKGINISITREAIN